MPCLAKCAFFVLAVCAVPGAPMQAQSSLRDVHGVVTDQHHEPLRGAVVYLENESTEAIVTFLTDRGGEYDFKRVSADSNFFLWATYRGVQTKKKLLSRFDSKTDKVVRLTIHLR